jgi:hypothetical protein
LVNLNLLEIEEDFAQRKGIGRRLSWHNSAANWHRC